MNSPSALRAFGTLVIHSFQRHWQVRQMGWIAAGLLAVAVIAVVAISARPGGWTLPDRGLRRGLTYREYGELLTPKGRYDLLETPPANFHTYQDNTKATLAVGTPTPLDPTRDALQSLILSVPHVILSSEKWNRDWAAMKFTWWIVAGAYLGFVLPLFTLAYASGAFGTERESRTLVWLMTRPIPRWAIYLAKFLGALPWCLLFGVGGFVALCAAGGEPGRESLKLYWPAALAATVAYAAVFHLIGAIFRRPVVVGLVYVFFFEALVGALPGSLKLLSLTFYARCLMYNGAADAGYPVQMLDVTGAVSDETAWAVLAAATVGLTAVGMWLFSRTENRDDL